MAINFGSGATLKDASPWLRDKAERHARILRVTECNSIIEGLPPFDDETRARIKAELSTIAAKLSPEPSGSLPTSGDSSG
jgi:hypothetical protein